MTVWYPLRLEPIYRQYIWGGNRFASVLDRDLDSTQTYAESWEVVDHGNDQSVVQNGLMRGITLHELLMIYGPELVGYKAFARLMANPIYRFPLLLKYLDAKSNLSLQVHPDNRLAAEHNPPDLGKTEAWVVLDAEPGAKIYAGLKPGVDRARLEKSLRDGDCVDLFHQFDARPGDAVLIPAGTVHALGQGCLVAEIQQSSDITYRLYDWDRVDDDGNRRPLHIEQGLDAIDFDRGPIRPVRSEGTESERLIECEEFSLVRHRIDKKTVFGGRDSFRIFTVLDGTVSIQPDPVKLPLSRGQTVLIPAGLGEVEVTPDRGAVILDCFPSLETRLPAETAIDKGDYYPIEKEHDFAEF